MNWERLISDKRLGMEEFHDRRIHIRSDFQRDYDRMIFSSPFRRLQNKTQVFPLPGSIFVHNRLTHSLEVSSVGRSMAREAWLLMRSRHEGRESGPALDKIPDIVAAACLCHDLGNPPFGHSGEKTISTWFSEGAGLRLRDNLTERQWCDFSRFEGNANSFRLLTHQFCGRRKGGFAMTYSTLASIVKYPWTSLHGGEKGKFGFFESEEEDYRRVALELGIPELEEGVFARHPLVYLMEAADDICYQVMDIEDSHRLGILSTDEVKSLLLSFFGEKDRGRMERAMGHLDDPNEQVGYLRSNAIGVMVGECAGVFADNEERMLAGERMPSLVSQMRPRLAEAYSRCSHIAWNRIYCASDVVDVDIAGNRIITYLMDALMDAVLHPERNSSKLLLLKVPRQYDTGAASLYERLQSVLDHVSGMTDVYALDLFRKLNGHSLPAV
ncbi:MAG: dNTP triphosphohydrolase [Muribaculaceae bacterium]|nr:dNTP triphosphohydrolase [Muribaculaceae bacterium]MDE6533400.1 dNTP triphosphohydrolase [Muribaculaceae bacterium]